MIADISLPPYLTWLVLGILGLNVWLIVVTVVRYVIDKHREDKFWDAYEREMEDDEDAT